MKNTRFFYIIFQVLKILLIKMYKISHQFFYFLFFYFSFYISRYNFFTNFRIPFKIIGKKIFVTNFRFLTDSLKHSNSPFPPHTHLTLIRLDFLRVVFLGGWSILPPLSPVFIFQEEFI